DKLADHIRMANKDADDVQISSRKISNAFERIKAVELEVAAIDPVAALKSDAP
ncbi:MAG: DNA recombination protein RmuC, partial [Burkholderiales bacterium]